MTAAQLLKFTFMPTTLKVYTNEDDSLLFWSIVKPIKGCRGFAIERKITRNGDAAETSAFLVNRTGFGGKAIPLPTDGRPVIKPSTEWPFQRFNWTDHDVNTGDTVSYRIVPMVRNAAGDLEQVEAEASAFSDPRTLGVEANGTFQPFFNRGFVMSQFMSRFLAENKLTLKQFKNRISDETDKPSDSSCQGTFARRCWRNWKSPHQKDRNPCGAVRIERR